MKRRLLAFAFAASTLFSCKKADTAPSFEGCLLKEVNDGYKEYRYDKQRRLIERRVNNPLLPTESEVFKLEYDSQGRIVKYARSKPGGEVRDYFTYKYNASGQLAKRNAYSRRDGVMKYQHSFYFDYDAMGRLVQVHSSRETFDYEYLLVNAVRITLTGSPIKTVEAEFDDKANPFYFLSPSLALIIDDFEMANYELLSPNNVLRLTTRDAHGNLVDAYEQCYAKAYAYNANGFPVQATYTFPDGEERVENLFYDCEGR